jgi:hypothetical protein
VQVHVLEADFACREFVLRTKVERVVGTPVHPDRRAARIGVERQHVPCICTRRDARESLAEIRPYVRRSDPEQYLYDYDA